MDYSTESKYLSGSISLTPKGRALMKDKPKSARELYFSHFEEAALSELLTWESNGVYKVSSLELYEGLSEQTDARVVLDRLENRGLIRYTERE